MPYRRVAYTVEWVVVAFHHNTWDGRQVACVQVQASDDTAATPWQTVATTVISTSCEGTNPVEVYRGTLDITALNSAVGDAAHLRAAMGGCSRRRIQKRRCGRAPGNRPTLILKDLARFAASLCRIGGQRQDWWC